MGPSLLACPGCLHCQSELTFLLSKLMQANEAAPMLMPAPILVSALILLSPPHPDSLWLHMPGCQPAAPQPLFLSSGPMPSAKQTKNEGRENLSSWCYSQKLPDLANLLQVFIGGNKTSASCESKLDLKIEIKVAVAALQSPQTRGKKKRRKEKE